jgi:hypothetical protein
VAKNLAGRAVALRSANRLGLPASLAYACGRVGEFQGNFGQDMMVQHQDDQQVQLQHCQQQGDCSPPRTMLQETKHDTGSRPRTSMSQQK